MINSEKFIVVGTSNTIFKSLSKHHHLFECFDLNDAAYFDNENQALEYAKEAEKFECDFIDEFFCAYVVKIKDLHKFFRL